MSLTAQAIRNIFIDYFKQNDHRHINSSSLIPHNDPSLMFVNSGMVQFKDVFTGAQEVDYKRAVTAQKCVRAGGKHNDLDNVGYTARHHTFFEMLGNFSFGDYFKEEAICYSWNLLTEGFKLPKDKLYITVYEQDVEAFKLWKKLTGFSDDRIIKINTNDNFWSMGDTGPCGPCSEIFYDHGEHVFGGLPGTEHQDGDRFIEVWNLVFMQYQQMKDGSRISLPNQSVDTGMGLERVSAILQNVHNNYEIDIFEEIIETAESILKVKAKGEALFSYRVIADHLRSSAFLIADGVMPSNEGRGYVLRRIMRRAMRHAHQLGSKEPLMYKLLPKLIDQFGSVYPELIRAREFVSSILMQEEQRFKVTLDRGLKLLQDEAALLVPGGKLSGEVAFKLYDTYGFPLDLTEDILKKQEITVDKDSFKQEMDQQKERARKVWSGSGFEKTDPVWFEVLNRFGSTEFLGYQLNKGEGEVLSIVQNGKIIQNIDKCGEEFILIVNQTPFYGESGGQAGDVGVIENGNCQIKVKNSLKFLGKIIGHVCELTEGSVAVGNQVSLAIDVTNRDNLRMHHTATHILHAALQKILGKHVTQKGSLVLSNKLRFDISHPQGLSADEIAKAEALVNRIITNNSEVVTEIMPADEAIKVGAMALFGEKYDDEVRVVSLGKEFDDNFSMELCGGTHVQRTGDIGAFKILSESAVAAGVRRIEAACGEFAFAEFAADEELILNIAGKFKSNKKDLPEKIDALISANKELEKKLERVYLQQLSISSEELASKAIEIGSVKFVYKVADEVSDIKIIRVSADNLTKKFDNLLLVYSVQTDNQMSLVIGLSKSLLPKINANDLAKKLMASIGGRGGGQPLMVQIGGLPILTKEQIEKAVMQALKGL